MTVLFNIAGLVSVAWFVTGALFVFVGAGLYFYDAVGAKDRGAIATWLRAPGSGGLYTSLVGGVLDRVDRALTPESVEQVPDRAPGKRWWPKPDWRMELRAPTATAAQVSGRAAFGWPLFDAVSRFAVGYPIVLLVLFWAATGDAGRVGPLEVLPHGAPTWQRGAAICLLVLVCVRKPLLSLVLSPARPIGESVVLDLAVDGVGAAAIVVAVAGVVAFAVTGAFAVTFAFVGVGAVVFAFAGAGAVAVAVAGAFAITFAVEGTVASCVRKQRGALGYGGFVFFLMLCLTLAATFGKTSSDFVRTALVFLALLPLVNACFDFVSIGTTRWLVRVGTERRRWALVLALGDVAAAAVFFTALGCTLIAVLHGLNQLADPDLLDLQGLFDGVRAAPGQYWWLYATIFTTLVPTFLHVAVAGASAIAWLPQAWKRPLLRHVEGATEWAGHRWIATLALAAIATLAILVPLFLAAGGALLLYHFYPEIGGGYLRVFEGFARWIGATVEPGPLILAT
jgi:hypothetical protein